MKAIPVRIACLVLALPAGAQCPGDVNGDNAVSGTDLSAVLSAWGSDGQGQFDADLNNDGTVNGTDLTVLLSNWGTCITVPTWATAIEALPDPAVVHDASLRAAIAATGYAWRVRDTATQIEMVLIPPGSFEMGCSRSNIYPCDGDESPVHAVTLTNAFYMGRYEVTQAQWTARMGSNPSFFQSESSVVPASQVPNRPVERVSWSAIQGFLGSTGMRLPTEAEWEHAYRAGTATAFHSMPGHPSGTNDDFGSLPGTIAWYSVGSASQTHPVGQKAGNGFGLHDMSGNVREWVNDWYSATYYASSPSVNPPGPSSGSARVLRGGSYGINTFHIRSSRRDVSVPSGGASDFGFRVVRALF